MKVCKLSRCPSRHHWVLDCTKQALYSFAISLSSTRPYGINTNLPHPRDETSLFSRFRVFALSLRGVPSPSLSLPLQLPTHVCCVRSRDYGGLAPNTAGRERQKYCISSQNTFHSPHKCRSSSPRRRSLDHTNRAQQRNSNAETIKETKPAYEWVQTKANPIGC